MQGKSGVIQEREHAELKRLLSVVGFATLLLLIAEAPLIIAAVFFANLFSRMLSAAAKQFYREVIA